jgi:hypothetical protein
MKCCHTCRYLVPFTDGTGKHIYAECHRLPPTAQRVPSASHPNLFPAVFDAVRTFPQPDLADWCGEYRAGKP